MPTGIDRTLVQWTAVIGFALICLYAQDDVGWLKVYPAEFVVPLADFLNVIMSWFVATFGWLFRGISWMLEWPVKGLQGVLHALPWSAAIFLCAVVSYAASGWRLMLFTIISMIYMVVVGYWYETMNSLSLVGISVPLAVLVGFAFGVWGFFSDRAERFIMPALDLLQTIPAFAYLLAILMLFGFGTTVGLIASLLFSFPPMVRNTILGLRSVPVDTIESGIMSGATRSQLFWQVQVPTASKQILLGVNQTTMAAFSMVIIASIIGGTSDIGWEVLSKMRKAQFGESVLAGIVIALMAMNMDRITGGLALREKAYSPGQVTFLQRHRYWFVAGVGAMGFTVLAQIIPFLREYPESWEFRPAAFMNDALEYVVVNYHISITYIKKFAFYFFMLPMKIGLRHTISPFTWGFSLTTVHNVGYAIVMVAAALYATKRWGSHMGASVGIFSMIMYFGLTTIPWPGVIAMFTMVAWKIGGPRLAAGTALGLGFLLVTGIWSQAMLSIYLCGLAAIISFLMGTAIGIWAAHNDRVSAFFRPINDTLQTMPLFVILIPFVMVFKIGEFTALLAIIAYSFVPAIRYAEHGLRNLPAEVLEAASAMGCTTRQLLWLVKMPLALPIIMLGLNQTIMYGIAMLVIAALVGTNGLGQRVYIGLGNGDFGMGMIAGLGMAIIAMIADRMTQAWSKKRQEAFGYSESS